MKHENQFFLFLSDIENAESYLQSNNGYPFYFRQLKTVEHKAIIRTIYKIVMHDDSCSEDQKTRVWRLLQNFKNLLIKIQSEGNAGNRKRHAKRSEINPVFPKKRIISQNVGSIRQSINTNSQQYSSINQLPTFPVSPIMRPQNCQQPSYNNLPYPFNLSVKNSKVKYFNGQLHSTPNKHK